MTDVAPDRAPAPRGRDRYDRVSRRNRIKLVVLALLLALLAMLLYALWYWNNNKQIPIPAIETGDVFPAPQYLYSISGGNNKAAALRRPLGVAVSDDNRVYVADVGSRAVRVFTVPGRYLFSFSKIDDGAKTTFHNPSRVEVSDNGEVWVVDRGHDEIYIFDRNGGFLRKYRPKGIDKGGWAPAGVSFDSSGTVYVTDVLQTKKHQVYVFSKDGKKIAQFGATQLVNNPGEAPGKFYFPNLSAVASDTILVTDSNNRRLQAFSLGGKFKYLIATGGTPRGIVIDSKGHVFVSDVLSHMVDIYDLEGRKLVSFGENGVGPGQFRFPGDVKLNKSERLVFIADRVNNQVQVWGWPAGRPVLPPIPGGLPAYLLLCLSPLLLLLLPLLRRKKKFVVTEDFVDAIIFADRLETMQNRRWRWVVPEEEHVKYEGRVHNDIDLGELLVGEAHSATDAQALEAKLDIAPEQAVLLSMAQRYGRLFTEDAELRRLGVLLKADVYNRDEYLEVFAPENG